MKGPSVWPSYILGGLLLCLFYWGLNFDTLWHYKQAGLKYTPLIEMQSHENAE